MAYFLKQGIVQRYAIAIFLTAFVMAWLAPLESSIWLTRFDRYIFWFVTVTLGWMQMIAIAHGLRSMLGAQRYAGWVLLVIASCVGAVSISAIAWYLWDVLKVPDGVQSSYGIAYSTALFINVNFSLLQWCFVEKWPLGREKSIPDQVGLTLGHPQLPCIENLGRAPENLSGEIICLHMEDHYMRIYTAESEELILWRMRDAVRDLADTDGMQVHRSWWVGRQAVVEVYRKNKNRFLRLRNGLEVPIGRSFYEKVQQAGWFDSRANPE